MTQIIQTIQTQYEEDFKFAKNVTRIINAYSSKKFRSSDKIMQDYTCLYYLYENFNFLVLSVFYLNKSKMTFSTNSVLYDERCIMGKIDEGILYNRISYPIPNTLEPDEYFQNSLLYNDEILRAGLIIKYFQLYGEDFGMVDIKFEYVEECIKILNEIEQV